MIRRYLLMAFALVLAVGLPFVGCKKKDNPTTPEAPVATFTNTSTRTATPAGTATFTRTFTSAATSTFTFTPSATPTLTNSNTPAATATFTFTLTPVPTSTPTDTLTPTNTATPTPVGLCARLINGCESLTENGTWSGANSTRTLSTSHVTQGSNSIDVNITTGAGWNQEVLNWSGFAPFQWDGNTQLQADVYVDGNLVTGNGATYANLELRADSTTQSVYGHVAIALNQPLVPGPQTLAWNLDYSQGTILPGSPLTKIYFIMNSDQGNTGHIYIDNIRLVYNCATPPPVYPAWNFDNAASGTELWSASAGTLSQVAGGYNASAGTLDLNRAFALGTGTDTNVLFNVDGGWNGGNMPFDFTGRNMRCWVKASAAVVGDGTPQAIIKIGSNGYGDWYQSAGTNLVADTWTLVDWNPITWTVPSDATKVNQVIVQILMGTDGTTRGTGDVLIDQVEVY